MQNAGWAGTLTPLFFDVAAITAHRVVPRFSAANEAR